MALALAAGCGGGGSSGGPVTLNWYIFPEFSGAFVKGAADCSKASNGAYQIKIQTLPNAADGQRQQMVRRLAGTLVEVGRGNLDAASVEKLLREKSIAPAKWTAPPSGLFLEKVQY